ncbi:MAG: TadE/TadG family type IV pilus assembly protein [Pseudomonadota bacterium]
MASRSILRRFTRSLRRTARDERGVSAVEFSLVAPLLVFGTIMTVDAGLAIYDKMMIGQVLRSGAQTAIAAQSQTEVRAILEATASDNFTVAAGPPTGDELSIGVSGYCVCPSDTSVQVACTASCTGGSSPLEFYQLSATKTYTGILLPAFTLDGTMDVLAQ